MTDARKKARERIKRLREMTAARGCTEAEAISAAEKAAKLMRDHGISEAEIAMDEQRSRRRAGRGLSVKAKLWPIIGACTNTAPTIVEDGVVFIGREPGPEIAVYLRDICERAVDRHVREFKRSTFYRRRRGLASKRAAVSGFTEAMVNRLGNRLWEIFGPLHDDDAIDQALIARDQRFGTTRSVAPRGGSYRHWQARAAGWTAGDSVNLSKGVGGSAEAPRQIAGGAAE